MATRREAQSSSEEQSGEEAKGTLPGTKRSIDETLRRLPGGGKPFVTVHDSAAEDVLKLAERLVEDARKRLGEEKSKPRATQVEKLFMEHAKAAPAAKEQLYEDLRRPDRVEQTAELDETWDKAFAEAVNTFDKVSIDAGSDIQKAADDWEYAVRVYRSAARTAGAIFEAEVAKARAKPGSQGGSYPDIDAQCDYYARSSGISTALVKYEGTMEGATSELAKALGDLVQKLFDGTTKVSVGEANLIDAVQKASEDFWKGVQAELEKRS